MKFVTDDGEVITAADHAAGIIEGTAKTEYVGATKVISVRLPLFQAIKIQALAMKSGKTRNATIGTLLEVGLEEVLDRLTDETLAQVDQIESQLHQSGIQGDA